MPFREAHSCAGKAVYIAESKNVHLSKLTVEDLQTVRSAVTFKLKGHLKVYICCIYLFLSFSPVLCLTRTFLQCGTTSKALNSTAPPVARPGVASQLKLSTLEPGYSHKNNNHILISTKANSRCFFIACYDCMLHK